MIKIKSWTPYITTYSPYILGLCAAPFVLGTFCSWVKPTLAIPTVLVGVATRLVLDGWSRFSRPLHPGANWPRLWELLGFMLPKKIREKVYEPGQNELLADFLRARAYRTKWARRWLCVCFTFRTVLLVADCWRAMLADKTWSLLLRPIPDRVKRWWFS